MPELITFGTLPVRDYRVVIERTDRGPRTKAQYIRVIDNMLKAGCNPIDQEQITAHASELSQTDKTTSARRFPCCFTTMSSV